MIDGVVRSPSEFSMTLTSLPSMTATQEFVVPRSMPMILPIYRSPWMAPIHLGRSTSPILDLDGKLQPRRPAVRSRSILRGLRHDHHRRTHQSPIQRIALLQHLEHRVRLRVRALDHADSLMELRVERLADRVELLE